MADRDKTPIKVKLDVARMFRADDADTEAVTVGPGEVEVPKWVALEWGLLPAAAVAKTKEPTSEPAPTPTPTAEATPTEEMPAETPPPSPPKKKA
jgi:hypothetical protein